ncbi:MAG: TolC family protein [Planctomycetes bacterium]|nr:TolC family protein [Planctomycetota bacterium]
MRCHAKLVLRLTPFAVLGVASGCVSPPESALTNRMPAPPKPFTNTHPRPIAASQPTTATQPPAVVQTNATEPVAVAASGEVLDPNAAVQFALRNNPMLQAVRQQRGFAQGGIVIARTYQYNPISQLQFFGVTGGGVTNRLSQAHKITMDIEVRHQRHFRKQAAYAALTRTEWEIATQELAVCVAANRAFNGVLYREKKLAVLEDTIKLNEQTVEQVKKLVDLGRLRPADLVVARTELDAAHAQLGQGKAALAVARADLRRQFGTFDDTFAVKGDLDLKVPTAEFEQYRDAALEQRPDLQARTLAATEAQARLQLQVADRYGNPNFGPSFDYNETQNAFIGVQIGGPIPVFNRKTGEIIQAQATYARALADVRQFEVQAVQDVQAALARLAAATKWADSYSAEVLPNLRQAVKDMNKLLEQNDPGVDALKVIGVQRNYLASLSTHLDALFELSQARSDLAAAVGDPAIALGLYAPAQPEAPAPRLLPAPPKKDQP